MKKCKNCSEKFTPRFSTLEKYCWTVDCKVIEAMQLLEKKKQSDEKSKRVDKVAKKKEMMTLQDWIKLTQQVVNKYIRERDKNELNCISCGKLINGVRHASHYLSAGNNYSVRFNTDNIWVSCYKCNVMLSGNQLEYRQRLIEKIGIERVEYLESIAKETVKYTVEDLQNIIKEFKEKIKLLNN